MTDDSPSRDTFNYPSFLTIADYDALEQNTNDNNTLEANLNVSALHKPNSMKYLIYKPVK